MTKSKALSIVYSAAEAYKENLMNRTLLLICTDKHKNIFDMEVTFDKSNFKHLTGLKTDIDALRFFDLCINKRLSENDFEFAEDGTTPLKMNVLPRIVTKNLSANMLGDYNAYNPKLFTEKLAGNVSACIGFVKTGNHGRYVPNTVLEGDIRDRVDKFYRIILTYRKKRDEKEYNEIVYSAKKVEWSKLVLPEELSYLPLPE